MATSNAYVTESGAAGALDRHGIVKQSGGYVWAESRPGEGSRFNVLLPRVEAT